MLLYGEFDTVIWATLSNAIGTVGYERLLISHTLSSSLILMLLALPTFRSHLYNPYLTLKQILPPWSHESSAKSFQTIYYRFHKFCWWIRNSMLHPLLLHLGISSFGFRCLALPSLLNGSHCTVRHWMLLSWSHILLFLHQKHLSSIEQFLFILILCFVSQSTNMYPGLPSLGTEM